MVNNACPNRIAETSGTDFSQDLQKILSLFSFLIRVLQPYLLVTYKIFPGQAFAHCPKFSTADPTQEFRPYLSSNVAAISFNSAKNRKLGTLLPYQQLNPILAYYSVTCFLYFI